MTIKNQRKHSQAHPHRQQELTKPNDTQRRFFGYLVLQALVLLIWWPINSLFERIDTTGEPSTLAAVVVFTGVALAYFAIQSGVEEIDLALSRLSARQSESARQTEKEAPARSISGTYWKNHFQQLGLLLALCTPITLVAHSIASVSATHLLWIAVITAIHTSCYRLLASWLRLRWAQRDTLLTLIALRATLVAVYLCTTVYLPALSHVRMSLQLAQPTSDASSPLATVVLPFIVTYAALNALLCVGLTRQLTQRVTNAAIAKESDIDNVADSAADSDAHSAEDSAEGNANGMAQATIPPHGTKDTTPKSRAGL